MKKYLICAALTAAVLSLAAAGTVAMAAAENEGVKTAAAETAGAEKTALPAIGIKSMYMYDQDEQEPYTTYGTGTIQTIALDPGEDAGLSALAAALDEDGKARRMELKNRFDEYCAGCRQELADAGNERKYEVSLNTRILPRRFDDKMFSFLEEYTDYSGGAHGYHCYTGYNYDPATGKKLALSDLVKNDAELKGILVEELLTKYGEDTFGGRSELEDAISGYGFSEGAHELKWVGSADGLLCVFNPYDVAAYAAGVLTVNIGFDKFPDLFTGDYSAGKEAYVEGMMEWIGEEIDPDHDGATTNLTAWKELDDNGFGASLTVKKGEESCTENVTVFEMQPLLVHTADGKTWLYIDVLQENDWHSIEVFDVNGDCPVHVGSIPAGMPHRWDDEDGISTTEFPSNPDCFVLTSRLNVLGTYSGEKHYAVGEDGMAVPMEDYYKVTGNMVIKTARELPALEVDADTHEAGAKTTVPAGEELKIAFTNGEDYADLMRADGSLVRVQLDGAEWPHQINGEDEASYFETLFYAG